MRSLNTLFMKAKNIVKQNEEKLYLAFIDYENNMYSVTCCYLKNGREIKRDTTNHKTKEDSLQHIQNMVDKYPYENNTLVIYGSEELQ